MMWEILVLLLGTIVFLYYLLKIFLERNSDFWAKKGVKTLHNDLTLLQLLTGKRSPLDFDLDYYKQLGEEKFGGVIEVGSPLIIVKDLELAKLIFVKDFDHFIDRRDFGSDPILSESLLLLQGQKWKNMRSFLSPTFTSGKIRRMFQNFEKSGQRLKSYIRTQCPKSSSTTAGYDVLIAEATRRFTVDVIGATGFGIETDAFTNTDSVFYKMANKTGEINFKRIVKTLLMTNFPRLSKFLSIKIFDDDVNDFFVGILTQSLISREASSEKRDDFLQLLVEANNEEMHVEESELNQFEKDAQIKSNESKKQKFQITRDEAIAQGFLFFVAGFDTVTNFLNIALYNLAVYPDQQEKVYAEIDDIVKSSNDKITYEGVNKMEYLDMFIAEVMRMYPPAQRLERKCVKDYPIPGTNAVIPKGVMTVIPTEAIHKDEKYYPDPLKFDPERFTAENKGKRSPYAHMPFGIGPRNCIGMRFALIEAKVALAHLVHNFVVQPSEKTPIPVQIKSTLGVFKVVDNLELRLVPRS